ncbi:MAG: hypothetical protein KF812_01195, partial [Fimbriimonadaceae bacterium]|nr:hypothetical protein [Fimbriimonadaceae bacterium]
MNRFAFVLHPISVKDTARKYPIAKYLPDSWVESAMAKMSPRLVSEITGITGKNGSEASGVFIGLPLTPRQMIETLPLERVYDRIVQCAELAHREGAKIIGLGAFTSVVGDGGITVANRSPIAVTTGNSYTVATAIQGTLKACELLGINLEEAHLAVVGATGSIGKTCATLLSPSFARTYLVGRDQARTEELAVSLTNARGTTDIEVIRDADVIVTVTSSDSEVIEPAHLKVGAVVCDVARPRDVSVRVAKERPDVLVIEGGVVAVPGEVDFRFNFGFPPKTSYACMAETMMLALEGRYENFTLGKDVSPE